MNNGIFTLLKNQEYTQVENLDINTIQLNPYQTRSKFDDISDLAKSIKENSLLQPITVIANGDNQYTLIAGERRLKAMKLLKQKTIPAIVKIIDDNAHINLTLIENIQRNNLHPVEEARAYQLILDKHQYTHNQLSKHIGKSRSHISNLLRINKLNKETQSQMLNDNLSFNQIRNILSKQEITPSSAQQQNNNDERLQVLSKTFNAKKIMLNKKQITFCFDNEKEQLQFLDKLTKL